MSLMWQVAGSILIATGVIVGLAVETPAADSTKGLMVESGFWLTRYESPEQAISNVANMWLVGFWQGGTYFGGIQCPQEFSARTLAAATADTIKQRNKPKEDAVVPVLLAAQKIGCSVDWEAMNRAADLLDKKYGVK
jgi:hypothetical protein